MVCFALTVSYIHLTIGSRMSSLAPLQSACLLLTTPEELYDISVTLDVLSFRIIITMYFVLFCVKLLSLSVVFSDIIQCCTGASQVAQ